MLPGLITISDQIKSQKRERVDLDFDISTPLSIYIITLVLV